MDADSRRSLRVVASIPVSLIVGEDPPRSGLTAVVNRHGALLLSPTRFEPGSIVWVQNNFNSAMMRCRVIWVGVSDDKHHKVGVEFVDEALTFWDPTYSEAVEANFGSRESRQAG